MPIHVTTSTTQSMSNKTFVDHLSTFGTVYANGGTSNQWNNVYSSFNTQSAANASVSSTVQAYSATSWNYQGTDIKALTANWESTYTDFKSQSAANASVYSLTNSKSGSWDSVYSTVQTSSGSWGGGGTIDTGVRALTGNWQDTYTTFSTQSANNLSVYSTVQANSGSWVSRVAQVVTVQDATPKSTTATALITDAVPVLSNFSIYNELSATITPTDASSTLIFDIQLPTFQNTISLAVYSLFNNIAGNSLALATIGQHNAANYFVQTRLRYIVPAGSTSPQSFYLGFARTTGSTATVRINDGATPYWGNTQRSTMTITEIRP